MRNIIASYVKGTEQMPWEWKCRLLPLMKHLSANVDADTCSEAAQIPFAFLDTLLKKQHSPQKHFLRVFHVRGLITLSCSKAHGCARGVLLTLDHCPAPPREEWALLLIQREEQILAHTRPPLHGRDGFWPPNEKLQHRAVRSSSEKDAVCI